MPWRGFRHLGQGQGISIASSTGRSPMPPTGCPLLGPMPGVRERFRGLHSFTFGIAQAGGAGKVLAEWITEGQTEWDMWAVRPTPLHRLLPTTTTAIARRRWRPMATNTQCTFRYHAWPAGRGKKLSPVHDQDSNRTRCPVRCRITAGSAPTGSPKDGRRCRRRKRRRPGRARRTMAEARPGKNAKQYATVSVSSTFAGLLPVHRSARRRRSRTGSARPNHRCSLPRVGRMGLGYFRQSDKGRIVTEMSIMRTGGR